MKKIVATPSSSHFRFTEPTRSTVPHVQARERAGVRWRYRALLLASLTFFNSARLLAYLPTLWTIWSEADSSHHSFFTWGLWLGANLTMAAWIYEESGRRVNCVVALNMGNALMCLATIMLMAAYR